MLQACPEVQLQDDSKSHWSSHTWQDKIGGDRQVEKVNSNILADVYNHQTANNGFPGGADVAIVSG